MINHLEKFAFDVRLPRLLPKRAKKILYLASFFGNDGHEVYNDLFEEGMDDELEVDLKQWAEQKKSKKYDEENDHFHYNVNPTIEEWNEVTSYINENSLINKK